MSERNTYPDTYIVRYTDYMGNEHTKEIDALTVSQLDDRKQLATTMIKASAEMSKIPSSDWRGYRAASDKYWKASDKLYNKYGVY